MKECIVRLNSRLPDGSIRDESTEVQEGLNNVIYLSSREERMIVWLRVG